MGCGLLNIDINDTDYRNIVLNAVKRYGGALKYVHYKLKNDYEIVFNAVKQYSPALEYADWTLRDFANLLKLKTI